MSVFLAVDLDVPAREAVASLIETHRANHEAKWLRADKLHCTLTFLGNPSADQVEAWKPMVDSLAARHGAFELSLAGAGSFETRRAPSVLWLGIDGEVDALRALQKDAEATLGDASGHVRTEYVPHVTLARAQKGAHFEALVKELSTFRTPTFRVTGVTLYESLNHVYRPLHASVLSERSRGRSEGRPV